MKKRDVLLLSLVVFLIFACSKGESERSAAISDKIKSGKKLASQGDVEVHEGFLEFLGQVNPNISQQLKNPAGKKRLVDSLLEQELLYQASLKRGIAKNPKYQEKAALYERVIYAQGLLEEEIDVKAKEYYDKNKEAEFTQVKIAHILLRAPAEKKDEGKSEVSPEALNKAKEAKAKLDSGVAWEKVVEEYSDDRLTKAKGGELGFINRNDRRAKRLEWEEIIQKSFAMKAGEISEPLKARDGIHIIKVLEGAGVAPYEEVETRIKFSLRGQVKNEVLSQLTGGETIFYEDEELKALAVKPQAPTAPALVPAVKEATPKPEATKPPEGPKTEEKKPTVEIPAK